MPRRSDGLRRGGALRRGAPLRRVSDAARALRTDAQPIVDAVLARDGECVLRLAEHGAGPCRGRLTPHHLVKAWKGPGWTLDNLVALCVAHQGWVEDEPSAATQLGLVVRDGMTHADAWARMFLAHLPVGTHVWPCPGSGLPPASEQPPYGRCSSCRLDTALAPAPDSGVGPVCQAHAWSAEGAL